MKKLFIITIFALISVISYSQTYGELIANSNLIETGIDRDGDYYIVIGQKDNIIHSVVYYFHDNKKESVYFISQLIFNKKDLPKIIKFLNANYYNIGDLRWMSLDTDTPIIMSLFITDTEALLEIADL